jgi:hypothetical protein
LLGKLEGISGNKVYKLLSSGPPGEVAACHFLEARCGSSNGWWGVSSKLPARVENPILTWLPFVHPNTIVQ